MSQQDPKEDAASNLNGSEKEASIDTETSQKVETEKWKNDYLYLRAEFDNFRRQATKERSEYLKYGSERLIVDLLSVVDNFERALETNVTAENWQNFVKGIQITANELRSTLQKFGVAEIPAIGQNFDPSIHEALSSEESNQYSAGKISRVFKKPYKLHEKIIRPGQVVVAKEPIGN